MDQEQQKSLRDIGTGLNLVLGTLFSISRTVQIWSRMPGTTGTWFFGFYYFVGSLMQTWYCRVNEETLGRTDLVSQSSIMGLSLIWFSIHGVIRGGQFLRGTRFHSFDPGVGILSLLNPKWNANTVSLASDLLVATALSLFLWLLRSPILSGWYASLCVWLVLAHCWILARDTRRMQAWTNSEQEAAYWSEQLRRRPRS